MKVEISVIAGKIAKPLAVVVICLVVGYVFGVLTGPSLTGHTGMGYLTSSDLNRDDIGTSIVLSRFCEGLGLKSSVYWQQDGQGNIYGEPICLPAQQPSE